MSKKLRGSVATELKFDEMAGRKVPSVDCWKVLNEYSAMALVPEHFGDLRAAELAAACQWALYVIKHNLPFTPPPEEKG